MSYLIFLLRWYNWLYVAGLLLAALSLARLGVLARAGRALGRGLGLQRVSGHPLVRIFGLAFGVIGLTVNGALHDYWPTAQEMGFLPGLVLTVVLAVLVTRGLGQVLERHFPEIKAVRWGAPGLGGREGRVVSRTVSLDYRAGRAQVMGEDETLHMVLCKTKGEEIPFGAVVVLGEYDAEDGRYYVERVGQAEASSNPSQPACDE